MGTKYSPPPIPMRETESMNSMKVVVTVSKRNPRTLSNNENIITVRRESLSDTRPPGNWVNEYQIHINVIANPASDAETPISTIITDKSGGSDSLPIRNENQANARMIEILPACV